MDKPKGFEIDAGFARAVELKNALSSEEKRDPEKVSQAYSEGAAHAHNMAKTRYESERNTSGI